MPNINVMGDIRTDTDEAVCPISGKRIRLAAKTMKVENIKNM